MNGQINIVIIEHNSIYRESLKTALDQVPGFKVVYDADNYTTMNKAGNAQVHEFLIDSESGISNCDETIRKAHADWPNARFLLLTAYREECNLHGRIKYDFILKNSSKKEFENKIKRQHTIENNNQTK